MLDVGQGLSVLVETAAHRLLYDTGPGYPSGFTAAQAAIVPYLRQAGVTGLDRLVISHNDNDHAGGLHAVRDAVEVASLWRGSGSGEEVACRAGESWNWDGVSFQVLHPGARAPGNENNRSCVLRVDNNGRHSLLLTGDIEAAVEAALVTGGAGVLRADTLVAPHHGSRSSSSPPWVAAVQPRRVLFSAGYRNPFNHPHPQVRARYRAAGAELLETASLGAVTLEVDLGQPERIQGYTERTLRYWWD
nr:ComEC/Rec2 family competence protein [Motiliproteus sp. SC1-56]